MRALTPFLFLASVMAFAPSASAAVVTTYDRYRFQLLGIGFETSEGGKRHDVFESSLPDIQFSSSTEISDAGDSYRQYGTAPGGLFTINETFTAGDWDVAVTIDINIPDFTFGTWWHDYDQSSVSNGISAPSIGVFTGTATFSYSLFHDSKRITGGGQVDVRFTDVPGWRAIYPGPVEGSFQATPATQLQIAYLAGISGTTESGVEYTISLIPEPSIGILSLVAGGLFLYRRRR